MSTVCAISTPLSEGAISLIRMSGNESVQIADRVFRSFSGRKASDMPGHTSAYGKIYEGEKTVDDVLLTVFREPKSYTGEDTVEISCHGGIFVTKKILSLLISNGAEPAAPGEFTKRAFLNGKLGLTQAEAVMDIISSEGERALYSANNMRDGAVFKKITKIRESLVSLLGSLAAWVDYPEEDLPEVEVSSIEKTVSNALIELEILIKSYDDGLIFKEGVETAIIGSPNVGKSSLMNMLLGFDRSIVTAIEGTTRDVIEESARIGDVTLRLCDTAGIRETNDTVENLGVNLARKKLEGARLIIAVFDASRDLSEDDKKILTEVSPKNTLVVLNKTDLTKRLSRTDFNGFETVEISVKEQRGIEEIKKSVLKVLGADTFSFQENFFASQRQKNCAKRACSYLNDALSALRRGETLDAVTITINEALSCLLELTGERASENVVDEVFSRFCVGK